MKYLVDTDWVADYLKGRAPAVSLLQRLRPDGLAIRVITFGEVYEGIHYGTKPDREKAALAQTLRVMTVLDVDVEIARRFALIRGDLRQRGLLIPQPDILIAATAIDYDLTLVTRNLRHFDRMPDLMILAIEDQT